MQQEQYNTNKTLEKAKDNELNSSALNTKIKYHLKQRDLSFVVGATKAISTRKKALKKKCFNPQR
ncbi:hypothetical protein NHP194004_15470 [Helicobacter suis]|nr:hypothetical protein NHP194004_15470 [Helicobacter suis]